MSRIRFGVTARTLAVLFVLGISIFPIYWMFVTALALTRCFSDHHQ